jgi:hypothetical protein
VTARTIGLTGHNRLDGLCPHGHTRVDVDEVA